MNEAILTAAGGLGLFLLGMLLLTGGLRALAGSTLRQLLRNWTRTPISGAVTGSVTTALVQSSSATIVATVGFVGAGLMSFPQALGIIFGANIGTTITGWLVAIIGFKLELGAMLAPLVLVGALLSLFGRHRWKHIGWALSGFSLLFIGIAAMQDGMGFLKDVVTPSDFPADTWGGRLQLVFIGITVTLVTQSSSAGVAAALAALGAGAISFPQAAAIVIGMDVGTTVTAALATIGGSVASRRTGYAHVIYNVLTGIGAFALLGPLTWLIDAITAAGGASDPLIALVAFHTTFNLLGAVAIIGFTRPFARFVIWLVPDRGTQIVARLDDRLLSDPAAASDAAAATTSDVGNLLFRVLADQLAGEREGNIELRLEAIRTAEEETRRFSEHIRSDPSQTVTHRRHMAVIHTLDHTARLYHRSRQHERVRTIVQDAELSELGMQVHDMLAEIVTAQDLAAAEKQIDLLRKSLSDRRYSYRDQLIARASTGEIDAAEAPRRMDAMRWLHRVAYHVWRMVHHQRIAKSDTPAKPRNLEPAIEVRSD
ncbi:MAG: Na/Pi cotransporter family protein [Rhizobiales bacterium]|nr:Na/Pi cotransporter family protein [Hyphomicrobiales bacterium]